jgi:hypothetical protein
MIANDCSVISIEINVEGQTRLIRPSIGGQACRIDVEHSALHGADGFALQVGLRGRGEASSPPASPLQAGSVF